MNRWGKRSLQVRSTLHPHLRLLCDLTLKKYDISLVSGLRGKQEQDSYFEAMTSHVKFPESYHNRTKDPALVEIQYNLSDAVDLIPVDTGYESKKRFTEIADYMMSWALVLDINLEWGGDFKKRIMQKLLK